MLCLFFFPVVTGLGLVLLERDSAAPHSPMPNISVATKGQRLLLKRYRRERKQYQDTTKLMLKVYCFLNLTQPLTLLNGTVTSVSPFIKCISTWLKNYSFVVHDYGRKYRRKLDNSGSKTAPHINPSHTNTWRYTMAC